MNILKQMVINYFNLGLYTADDLPMFVAVGWISQADADQLFNPKPMRSNQLSQHQLLIKQALAQKLGLFVYQKLRKVATDCIESSASVGTSWQQ